MPALPFKCPKCNGDLTEEVRTSKRLHVVANPKHPTNTQRGYVYHCDKCRKYYKFSTVLVECEIIK